jgi:amino acid adenylation domain-containing protein
VLAPVRTTSKFDLTCSLAETGEGIVGHLEYSTHLFDRGTIERMRGHFRTLLEAIVADPSRSIDRLPLLDAQEYATVVRDWNATTRAYPGASTLHARFREQVARTPDTVAAVDHRGRIAYRDLDAVSTRLARTLFEAGVGARSLVAICAERSIEMLAGMLAVLKAGAAYVPMDSSYPPERLAHMLRDSSAPVLLTQSWLREKLVDAGTAHIIDLDAFCTDAAAAPLNDEEQAFAAACCAQTSPGEWAYMMYTSGSTGAPKGALVTHAGALNHIDAELDVLGFDGVAVPRTFNFLQSAPASSDISVWQFLAPLMTGGRTAILEDVTDVERMVRVIRDEAIHLIELVPVAAGLLMAHLRALPQDQRALPSLRYLMATGETVAVELVNDWLALYPAIPVVNAYGPTEAADDITQEIITAPLPAGQHNVSIGRPLPNVCIYIVNDAGEPQPIGVPGEICVGGICVGDGYWNKPELTRDRFVPDRFVPNRFGNDDGARARLYRTGDLGRWRADGRIEYIKRRDHQVKIRGFRIELGEIEASLRKCPGVTEVAVVVREDRAGDKSLVGYVTTEDAAAPTSAEMKRFLAERLPMHMVPSSIMRLQAFALLPNGKLDRRNLPAPTSADIETVALVPPSTPMQSAMAKIWREILGIGEVGVDQNFFDLGGHSISATLVAARLRREFGIELPLRDIFVYPTIAQLAEIVVERQLASADSDELRALSASLDALSVEELEQMLLEQSS